MCYRGLIIIVNAIMVSFLFNLNRWEIIISWNIMVATIYSYDKFLSVAFDRQQQSRQQRQRQRRYFSRVSEQCLLLILFIFGPIGAWIAMELLRHKTSKSKFRRRAIFFTVFNPLWLVVYLAIKQRFDTMWCYYGLIAMMLLRFNCGFTIIILSRVTSKCVLAYQYMDSKGRNQSIKSPGKNRQKKNDFFCLVNMVVTTSCC